MHILLISQYFWPESFRINDIVLGLKERGHSITVLTGKPNYPKGSYFDGYGFWKKSAEEWNGIRIIRVPMFARGNGKAFKLLLNYTSFALFACVKVFFVPKTFDTVFVYEPSPITVGLPAVVLKKVFRKSYHFWVQDLWPASLTAAAGINNKVILGIFSYLTLVIYRNSRSVLVQSRAFIPYISNQGIEESKIIYLPNSTEAFSRINYGNKLAQFNLPDNAFNLLFAGNIGHAQSFETLLNAASMLKSRGKNVNWIILGDGRMRVEVEKQIKLLDLEDCFFLLGSFPVQEMPYFYSCADALLLSLKKDDIFSYTIPSKLQSYMAFGKPIIASLDGEGAKVIIEANAGFVSPAEDSIGLCNNIIKAMESNQDTMNVFSLNAIKYYEKEFERESILNKLESILNS